MTALFALFSAPRRFRPALALLLELTLGLTLGLALTGCGSYGSLTTMQVPRDRHGQTDPQAAYLIYVHDWTIEKLSYGPRQDRYGLFLYETNIKALRSRGFTVLGELRNKHESVDTVAARVAASVNGLLAAGVPADHVSVAGIGKGGRVALAASTLVARPEVRYALLGACGQGRLSIVDKETAREYAPNLSGRFLSIRDRDDQEAGSCATFFASAPAGTSFEEVQPQTGLGHGLFHTPRPEWIDPLARLAGLPSAKD